MKKRLFPALLALVLALTMLSVGVFASSDPSGSGAGGGTTGTTTTTPTKIEASTTTLSTGSYTLDGDVTLTGGLTVAQGAEVSIDLGNHTITGADSAVPLTVNGGKVTITGTGSILAAKTSSEVIDVVGASSELTINGTITLGPKENVTGTYTIMLSKNSGGSKVNITGATINGRVGIYVNGNTADGADNRGTTAPIINLNQVTIKATSRGLMLNGNANTTVDGGSITGGGDADGDNVGAEIRAGSLTVKGGAAIAGGDGDPKTDANGNGATSSNVGIAVAQHTTVKPITVNIEGGAKVSGGAALFVTNPQSNTSTTVDQTVTVSGTGTTLTSTHTDPTTSAKGDAVFAQAPVDIVIKEGAKLDGNVTMKQDTNNTNKGGVDITGATVNGSITNQSGDGAAVTVRQSTVTGTITDVGIVSGCTDSTGNPIENVVNSNTSLNVEKSTDTVAGFPLMKITGMKDDCLYLIRVSTVRNNEKDEKSVLLLVKGSDVTNHTYSFNAKVGTFITVREYNASVATGTIEGADILTQRTDVAVQ